MLLKLGHLVVAHALARVGYAGRHILGHAEEPHIVSSALPEEAGIGAVGLAAGRHCDRVEQCVAVAVEERDKVALAGIQAEVGVQRAEVGLGVGIEYYALLSAESRTLIAFRYLRHELDALGHGHILQSAAIIGEIAALDVDRTVGGVADLYPRGVLPGLVDKPVPIVRHYLADLEVGGYLSLRPWRYGAYSECRQNK